MPFSGKTELNAKNLGFHLGNAIQNSITTLFLICGYMVLAAVLITILEKLKIFSLLTRANSEWLSPMMKGVIEVTSGIQAFSNSLLSKEIILPLCSFLLGIGGLSVFMQVNSIISKTDLSIKPYIWGKITHGSLSSIYTFLFLKFAPSLPYNIITTFQCQTKVAPIISETSNVFTVLCTLLLSAILIQLFSIIKKTHS